MTETFKGVSNGLCEHLQACEQCSLRAWLVIKFFLRAASTVENTDGEQGALLKFSASRNLSFIKTKRCFASSNLAGTYKTKQ